MPKTADQTKRLKILTEPGLTVTERVSQAFPESCFHREIAELLVILGDSRPGDIDTDAAVKKHFSNASSPAEREAWRQELQSAYDWEVLARIIEICPGRKDGDLELIDLFNLIDIHERSGHGFHGTGKECPQRFINPERLVPARNALVLLIQLQFFLAWKENVGSQSASLESYLGFCCILAKMMQHEGLGLHRQGWKLHDREFYLFSYAVISMNWDPIFLWLTYIAHKEANNSPAVPYIGTPPSPMKMFNDMGHFMGVRRVESPEPLVWYPCNETATQRINDEEHVSDRRLRVGKFYFPHGSFCFRECPNCGKLLVAFGDEWLADSESLFPPPPLRVFSQGPGWAGYRRSQQELDAYNRGRADVIQCSYCGTMTESRHTPLVMQSSIKGEHPPYLEEIQRDMRVSLERAKHIIFLGYSLPPDDILYRAILSARQNREAAPYCSIVDFEAGAENKWLKPGDATMDHAVLMKAVRLFGKDRVRINLCGIPDVWLDGGKASEKRVQELLYPLSEFPLSVDEMRGKPIV